MKILLALILACLLTTTNIFSQSSKENWSFSTNAGMTGEIKVGNANIEISRGNYNRVEIRLESNVSERIQEYEVLETSNGFSILYKENISSLQNRSISEKFFISIPDYYNLNITSASGDIKIREIDGIKKLTTVSADIAIKNSNGSIKASTASGDIDIEYSNGDKDINTASGDVYIRSSSGNLKINSASGDISLGNTAGEINTNTASGDIVINTSAEVEKINANSYSGNISVNLNNVQGISLKATTISGELFVDENFNIKTNDSKISKTVSGITGNGEVKIVCKNVSGNITIIR